MALTPIYRISSYVNWKTGGTVLASGGGGSVAVDLSNYYTKTELQTAGSAIVDWSNIVNTYFIDSIEQDSSGVHLVGDLDSPGINKVYGTDGSGIKGWYTSSGGSSLWEADSIGDLYTATAGVGVYIDGMLIKNFIIDAQDGSLKHLTITAGDANGVAGTDAGNIYLRGGDAILNDSNSQYGAVYLVPGNGYTAEVSGQIYLGDFSSTHTIYRIDPIGFSTDIGVQIESKGNGNLIWWTNGILAMCAGSYAYWQTPVIYMTGEFAHTIAGGQVYETTGYSLTIRGADVIEGEGHDVNYNGGELILLGGAGCGTGHSGNIQIGDGSGGVHLLALGSYGLNLQSWWIQVGTAYASTLITSIKAGSDPQAGDIIIRAGEGINTTGMEDGGDLYLYAGTKYSGGNTGKIFLGTGSAGLNPLAGSGTGTSILLYNRETGEITYGDK
jgi:hypothetical protein